MSASDQIVKWLQQHPELRYESQIGHVEALPQLVDSYAVWLAETKDSWTVGFDGFHRHCDSEREAIDLFIYACGDDCRVRVDCRGNFPYRWTVECRDDHGWKPEEETGLFLWPFWRAKRIEYRYFNRSVEIGK